MPSINLDVDYFDHFKTKRLVCKLGAGAEVFPIKLWILAAKFFSEKGIFKNVAEDELLSLAGIVCHKDTTSILQALKDVGYLGKDHWWFIPQWEEHQGHIIAYKVRGKHAAQKRWNKLKPEVGDNLPDTRENQWQE